MTGKLVFESPRVSVAPRPSATTHITGIHAASSQPETSDQRPDTRTPPSTSAAVPEGRVELA